MEELTDVRYEVDDGLAWIVIDRPERLNAFRARTIDELIACFTRAWASSEVGVACLTGAGDRAFCTGGDQKQRAETADYGPSASGLFEVERLHRLIRDVPKPVIAAVNGYAIGDGHVLHVICDLTIAAETARFGQTGPRVGSFDAGFGTAYLARAIGEKRAREVWMLCRQYDAGDAERWGWSTRSSRPLSSAPRSAASPTTSSRCLPPCCASSSSRSTSTPSTSRGSASSRSAASGCSSTATRRPRASIFT
jgi:2-ketocyclohexanecarboxyl-CoA hydrolase